ncbi:neprilysin-4-like [Schistocerca americana]|uniref:neprilysin-4-like n=1 Tax=Schistocerca americana TaxID=7009 RepID=UPI001F4F90CC|nr:neprilysin-4-like [Schistocerca americana]
MDITEALCKKNILQITVFITCITSPSLAISADLQYFLLHPKVSATELNGLTKGNKVCLTEECKQAASVLLDTIDINVNPCEDFYEFACGGWVKKHPVPPTESHMNQFDVVTEKLDLQLKGILESPEDQNDPPPVNSAKKFYKSCMDLDTVEADGLELLSKMLEELGGWPMAHDDWDELTFDWQKAVAFLTKKLAVSPLILVYVYLDRKNSSRSVITIDQPSLGMHRSMLIAPDMYGQQLEAYRRWIMASAIELATYNNASIFRSSISVDSYNVVEFEIQLARLMSPNEMRRNAYRMYNAMTLRELQKWTDNSEAINTHSRIQWLQLMEDLFDDIDVKIGYDETVVVKEMDYLFKLVELLDNTPVRVIANYLNWRLVKTVSRDTTQKMRELAFLFEKVLSGTKEDQPRWRDCVFTTSSSLNFAVGYEYVKQFFDDEAKKSALEMVTNIREAFKLQVREVDWMDKQTRKVASEKADAMTELIGYPDWFSNKTALEHFYTEVEIGPHHLLNVVRCKTIMVRRIMSKLRKPTDRTEWHTSPDVVNAYYNPQTNSIIFPAGILQQPFFSKGRIEALNYGSIGVVIGHEITHGFDDVGRQSDKYGNLAQWWTEATIQTYIKKSQCFMDQYDAYRVPELDDLLHTIVRMNGVTTLGENIADNGGLRQAYHAYRSYVERNGPEPRLPGLEQFTPDQLFFLGFATVWCESTTSESLLQEVLSDPHSPHKYRVRGTLANSEDFSRVWKCPQGSPMNPKDKCLLW